MFFFIGSHGYLIKYLEKNNRDTMSNQSVFANGNKI